MEPGKTRDYIGPVTNTERWDAFTLRPGDIVLSTPPKSGTTWSQAILMMLIHGKAARDRQVWRDSLWLDCTFHAPGDIAGLLDHQEHRRCIKSHAPFDGIPYDPAATYIAVYRHPIDMHFSMMTHISRMTLDFMDHLHSGDIATDFARFLDAPVTDSGTDDLSLASLAQHFLSFRRFADRPNVHLFHYADLSRDLPAMIRRFAEVAGLDVTDDLAQDIAEAAAFGSMKSVATRNSRENSMFGNDGNFYAKGTSGKWVGKLTEDDLARYDARLSTVISDPVARRWLERGDAA